MVIHFLSHVFNFPLRGLPSKLFYNIRKNNARKKADASTSAHFAHSRYQLICVRLPRYPRSHMARKKITITYTVFTPLAQFLFKAPTCYIFDEVLATIGKRAVTFHQNLKQFIIFSHLFTSLVRKLRPKFLFNGFTPCQRFSLKSVILFRFDHSCKVIATLCVIVIPHD